MDLFYTSGQLSETSVPGSWLRVGAADGPDRHENLIRFLQVAEVLGVPLLPLAWDPAFEPVGRDGSTSRVNQSSLNAEVSFAYKRFNPQVVRSDISEEAFRQMQYDAIINEMTVFSHRAIRRHPNILNFVGASFEMSPVSDELWPVLVFTKADLGDFYTFLSTRSPLDMDLLVAICKEVASGVHIMHHYGVIHGDIKPTNILIEDAKNTGCIQVKVTDFGFSCFQAAHDSDVKVARTPPWEAPEWHSRYFSLAGAKAMDIYSFGLLCLWALFRHEKLTELGDPSVSLDEALLSTDAGLTARVQSLKRVDGSFLPCALRLVRESVDISDENRVRLQRLFTLTLCLDPKQRAQSMGDLIKVLGVPEDVANSSGLEGLDAPVSVTLPQWHGAFQTENIFFQLEMSHFRIQEYIAKALRAMSEGAGCNICKSNAAFQLAVCHSVGFGVVPDDNNERDRLLQKGGGELSSLKKTLDRIQARSGTMVAGFVVDLNKRGHRENLLDRYRDEGLLLEAASKHKAMAHYREKVFGSTHYSTIRAKVFLVGILCYNQSFQDALPIALENINNAGADIGLRDRLSLKSQLSYIYQNMSRLRESEAILRDVIKHGEQIPELKDSPEYLYEKAVLANVLLEKGDSKQALELSLATEKDAMLSLGPYHQTSISACRVVVEAFDAEGQLETAVWLHENLLGTIEKSHRAGHGVLIQQLAVLGLQYYRLERLDGAKGCYDRIQALVAHDINNASPAINAVCRYAVILRDHGKLAESAMILEHLHREVEKLLGSENQQFVKVLGTLAATYRKQAKLVEAETLERRVLDFRRAVLGDKHYLTLAALDSLGLTLMCRWRWAEAARICKQSLDVRDYLVDTPNETRITLLSMIARGLTLSHAYEEAIGFLDRLLKLIQQEDAERGTNVLSLHLGDIVLAALCEANLKQRPATRRRIALILATLQRPWVDAPVAVVHRLTILAKTCDQNVWQVETEQALVAARIVVEGASEYMHEPVVQRLEAVVTNFLEKTGESELVSNPEALEDELLSSSMGEMTLADGRNDSE